MSNLIVNLRDAASNASSADGRKVFEKATESAADVLKDNSVRDGAEKLVISFAHFRDSSQSEAEYDAWADALDLVLAFKKGA